MPMYDPNAEQEDHPYRNISGNLDRAYDDQGHIACCPRHGFYWSEDGCDGCFDEAEEGYEPHRWGHYGYE